MADLAQYLRKAGIDYRDRGTNVASNNLNICCIFCGEARYHLGIERDKLWGRCWVCGNGGPWGKIARQLEKSHPGVSWGDLKPIGQEYYIDPKERVQEKASEVLCRPLTDADADVWDWLTTPPAMEDLTWAERPRGVPRDVLMDAGIQVGVGRLRGYVVFQQAGSINARRYSDSVNGPRWWKRLVETPFLFGAEWCERMQPETGYVTEGIFDCLRLPIGSAVSILGSVSSDALANKIASTFKTTKRIMLALDKNAKQDQVGKLKLLLTDCGYEVLAPDWGMVDIPGVKDLDELYLARGPQYLNEFLGLTKVEVLL